MQLEQPLGDLRWNVDAILSHRLGQPGRLARSFHGVDIDLSSA